MYAVTIQPVRTEQLRFQPQCEHQGCKLPPAVTVQLSPERDIPRTLWTCQDHALALMPGYIALVSITA